MLTNQIHQPLFLRQQIQALQVVGHAQGQQQVIDLALVVGDGELHGGHGSGLRGCRGALGLALCFHQVLAVQGCLDTINDATRKGLRPLVYGLIADTYGLRCSSDRPAKFFNCFSFFHAKY